MSEQETEKQPTAPQSDTLHEAIVRIRKGKDKIVDPAEAASVLAEAVKELGLPRAIVSISIRERDLIPRDVLSQILNSGVNTNISPEEKIRKWINNPANLHKIHTVAEFAGMIGVTGGQLRAFMRTFGWRFRKSEGRTYEVRSNEKN